MRYISQYDKLVLFRKNGEIAHQFKNGVLVVGDTTTRNGTNKTTSTKAYTVDTFAYSSATETEIFGWKPDFAGKTIDESGAVRIECAGLGYLAALAYDGTTPLTSLATGYYGSFFEAPVLTGTTDAVVATAGIVYEVLSDSVIYDGVTYTKGQIITADGSTTATTGSGTFALTLPRALKNRVDPMHAEAFALAHLIYPEQAIAYWNQTNGGYTAVDGTGTSDYNFIGLMNR